MISWGIVCNRNSKISCLVQAGYFWECFKKVLRTFFELISKFVGKNFYSYKNIGKRFFTICFLKINFTEIKTFQPMEKILQNGTRNLLN